MRIRVVVLSSILAAALRLAAAAQDRRSVDLTINDFGISIGDSPGVNGLRLNFRDSRLVEVNGINVTIRTPIGEPSGVVNGRGERPAGNRRATDQRARHRRAGFGVGDSFTGLGIGGLGLGGGGSIRGIMVGGLGIGSGGAVEGISIGGLGIGSGGRVLGIAVGGLGVGAGGSMLGINIGSPWPGSGSEAAER